MNKNHDYLFLARVHLGIAVVWRQLQMWELAKHHQTMCARMMQLANGKERRS